LRKELEEVKAQNRTILAALNTPEGRRLIALGTKVDPEVVSLKPDELRE
jgi:hypothetical protein